METKDDIISGSGITLASDMDTTNIYLTNDSLNGTNSITLTPSNPLTNIAYQLDEKQYRLLGDIRDKVSPIRSIELGDGSFVTSYEIVEFITSTLQMGGYSHGERLFLNQLRNWYSKNK